MSAPAVEPHLREDEASCLARSPSARPALPGKYNWLAPGIVNRNLKRRLSLNRDQDLGAMFVEAAKSIALTSALLDAYRKSSGVVLRLNRSAAAKTALAAAADECVATCPAYEAEDWARAWEHVGQRAMYAYVGHWWEPALCSERPADLMEGDEFYSREEVGRLTGH